MLRSLLCAPGLGLTQLRLQATTLLNTRLLQLVAHRFLLFALLRVLCFRCSERLRCACLRRRALLGRLRVGLLAQLSAQHGHLGLQPLLAGRRLHLLRLPRRRRAHGLPLSHRLTQARRRVGRRARLCSLELLQHIIDGLHALREERSLEQCCLHLDPLRAELSLQPCGGGCSRLGLCSCFWVHHCLLLCRFLRCHRLRRLVVLRREVAIGREDHRLPFGAEEHPRPDRGGERDARQLKRGAAVLLEADLVRVHVGDDREAAAF
mmetsp:Transcript_23347/g.53056  ORF Transcript_23347/g.53056 Transcript_23347/m.53056 type:complete len:264 (+) Transcript_23347:1384-2175(+)